MVLSQCRYVVMDEADRMVHLGFENDLTFILDALPSGTMEGEDKGDYMDVDGETIKKGRTRVTTLFSATMPSAVERLAKKYLKRPAVITIGEAGRAVDTVEQRVEFVSGDEKKKWVQSLCEMLGLYIYLQTTTARNSQYWGVPTPYHRFRQPEEDCRYGGQGCSKRRSGCLILSHLLLSLKIFKISSGMRLRYILGRIKNNERQRCSRCAMANPIFLWLPILQVVVLTFKTLV